MSFVLRYALVFCFRCCRYDYDVVCAALGETFPIMQRYCCEGLGTHDVAAMSATVMF